MDLLECLISERLRKINAADLRTNDGRELVDGDRVVRRGAIGVVLVAGAVIATQNAHLTISLGGCAVGSVERSRRNENRTPSKRAAALVPADVGIILRRLASIRHAIVTDHPDAPMPHGSGLP